ncbi:MAG: hypothetical protein JXR95_04235 [Deltaproteobacteria bacterium]|nr:hypothetical protein [Deltaproteobacteria bacterium]
MKKFLLVFTVVLLWGCDDAGPEPEIYCGDGLINDNSEECDTNYEGDDTCLSLGYYGGVIKCSDTCRIDFSECEDAGRCGDGVVNEGETEENCCEDTGCISGICTENGCVPQWEIDCDGGISCSTEQPWECNGSDLPEYNCGECGCDNDMQCVHDVCYSQNELDSEREAYLLPMDRELDWYFSLMDTVMDSSALKYDDFLMAVKTRLHQEERLAAVLFGESHGSTDEQDLNMQLMMDIESDGWDITGLGIEDNGSPLLDATRTTQLGFEVTGISGDLTNVSYCNAALNAVGENINHEDGIYFQYMGSGHTSREVAKWDMHWGICHLPHTAECILSNSRMALTLIAFDPDIWMTLTDQILMWRIGNFYDTRENVTLQLSQTIGRWNTTFSMHDLEPGYDTTMNGESVNVRMIQSEDNPDVWFGFFPRPDRQPWLTRGFESIWLVSDIQDFLWEHQIKPGNCSVSWNFTPGEEELTYFCGVDSFEIEAHVDGVTFEVETYTLNNK